MNSDDLFTAPQLAKICSTDLKTIHNWVNKGEIKSFRTPGRHLRFRREDILEFLLKYGYPIPNGFTPRSKIVVLDTDNASARSLKRALTRDFDVETFSDHVDALISIGKQPPRLILIKNDSSDKTAQLVKRLTARDGAIPVAVYGSSAKENYAKAREAGAVESITNLDGKEIRNKIASIIGK